MLPPIKLGWMAGVIDLKGRLVRKNNKLRKTQQIVLIVETKEQLVIKELGSLTGTSPEQIERRPLKEWMRRGCTEHCPEAHIHVGDELEQLFMPPISRWTITGAGMVVVMTNLMPFIQIDRGYSEAIEEVIANTPLTGQGSAAVVSSIRRLSLLGWDLPEDYQVAME
jgi:hypothetical protein